MSQNLVVVKNDKLVFSNFYRKNNLLPIEIPIDIFFSNVLMASSFVLPIKTSNLHAINPHPLPTLMDQIDLLAGPQALVINSTSITELTISNDNDKEAVNQLVTKNRNNFYCRASAYMLESAATAGHFIGYDAVKIYEEAMKANKINLLPFVEVNLYELFTFIENVNSKRDEIIKNKDITVLESLIDPFIIKHVIQHK